MTGPGCKAICLDRIGDRTRERVFFVEEKQEQRRHKVNVTTPMRIHSPAMDASPTIVSILLLLNAIFGSRPSERTSDDHLYANQSSPVSSCVAYINDEAGITALAGLEKALGRMETTHR